LGKKHCGSAETERRTSLDELAVVIDWAIINQPLAALYRSPKGEKAWPPLAMFKALLLGTWYDLSDVMLAEALAGRASFRRFCGFARDELTPERTAFVLFRRELIPLRAKWFAQRTQGKRAAGESLRL
jgi:transposase, IS5 family